LRVYVRTYACMYYTCVYVHMSHTDTFALLVCVIGV